MADETKLASTRGVSSQHDATVAFPFVDRYIPKRSLPQNNPQELEYHNFLTTLPLHLDVEMSLFQSQSIYISHWLKRSLTNENNNILRFFPTVKQGQVIGMVWLN